MRVTTRALLLLPVLAALLGFLPAVAHAAPAQLSTIDQYRQWIHEARLAYPYPQTEDRMYRVMMCESHGDRFAVGGGGRWHGLFQYVPGTWRGWWNPYRTADIYDAKAQIFATAAAWQRGMQSAWSCYYLTR
jgi:hypothetical protein